MRWRYLPSQRKAKRASVRARIEATKACMADVHRFPFSELVAIYGANIARNCIRSIP